jgi:hypothetical protein
MPMWRCECGARNRPFVMACESCGLERPVQEATAPPAASAKTCAVCSGPATFWHELHQGDDGLRRCGRCHMEYLKSRASRPEDRCTEPGCPLTVREHMEASKRLTANIGVPPSTRPRRAGVVIDLPTGDYATELQQKKWAALTRLRERER